MKPLEEHCSISLGILIWSRACVVFAESCVSCSARLCFGDAREEGKQREENDGGAQNNGGRGGRRDLFGKSCMVV